MRTAAARVMSEGKQSGGAGAPRRRRVAATRRSPRHVARPARFVSFAIARDGIVLATHMASRLAPHVCCFVPQSPTIHWSAQLCAQAPQAANEARGCAVVDCIACDGGASHHWSLALNCVHWLANCSYTTGVVKQHYHIQPLVLKDRTPSSRQISKTFPGALFPLPLPSAPLCALVEQLPGP